MNSTDSDVMDLSSFTIVWMGPVYEISGYGSVSRNFVRQLDKLGARVKVMPIGRKDESLTDDGLLKLLDRLENTEIVGKVFVIFHGTADIISSFRFQGASKLVVMTIFETDSIPFNWKRILNRRTIDEVWVPSEFNVESFTNGGVRRSKLRKVPYGIFEDHFSIEPMDKREKFRFLYISNLGIRTATFDLIRAFSEEFIDDKNVELYLKIGSSNEGEMQNFLAKFPNDVQNVIVDTRWFNEYQIRSLIKSAGLYISVDRANGWGMPNMEGMRLGIPTATVNWSGSTEFSDESNSYLIEPSGTSDVYRATSADLPMSRLYVNQKWADISIMKVREVMRSAVEDSKRRDIIIREAFKTVNDRFNLEKICSKMLSEVYQLLNSTRNTQKSFSVSKITPVNQKIRNLILDMEYAIRGMIKYGNDNPFKIKAKNRHIARFLGLLTMGVKSSGKERCEVFQVTAK